VNVAIFTDNDFDKVNGVTTTLTAALRHAPADMRIRVYTAAALGVDEPHYLAVPSVGMPIPFYGEMRMYVPRIFLYLRTARKDAIDVVHLTTPGPVGLAAMYVASRMRLPMVGSFHTDLAAYTAMLSGSPRLGALMREFMRWPYGRCARVLVPSAHTRDLLIGAKGNPRRIHVWPRGVDTMLFSPSRRSNALRDQWHVSDKRPAILFVGRLSREKGLDVLHPLQRRLHALGVEHQLVLVGDGPMAGELERLLPEAVFMGMQSRVEVAEAFASADLFLFPSRTDTAGNVVLEAQASGLPVVVSGEGGPRENIVDGLTGVVCKDNSVSAWAASVVAVLRPSAHRAAMASAARTYALRRRWEHALQPLYGAYREVCAHDTVELQVRGPQLDLQGDPLLRHQSGRGV
jgi:glycosyltransferase involved in cell wall biosynthesis